MTAPTTRERVARAMYESLPQAFGWDRLVEGSREHWRVCADAAIAAMQPPTEITALEEPGSPRAQLMRAIAEELDHAYRKHGADPWGRHEFYSILLEEVEELWAEIKADTPQEAVLAELRQVAAMCFRYAETGDRYRGPHPEIPRRGSK